MLTLTPDPVIDWKSYDHSHLATATIPNVGPYNDTFRLTIDIVKRGKLSVLMWVVFRGKQAWGFGDEPMGQIDAAKAKAEERFYSVVALLRDHKRKNEAIKATQVVGVGL